MPKLGLHQKSSNGTMLLSLHWNYKAPSEPGAFSNHHSASQLLLAAVFNRSRTTTENMVDQIDSIPDIDVAISVGITETSGHRCRTVFEYIIYQSYGIPHIDHHIAVGIAA